MTDAAPVSRETITTGTAACTPGDVRLCSRCRAEPAKPGQRWGRACHAAYMRERRRQARQVREELLALVGELREAR